MWKWLKRIAFSLLIWGIAHSAFVVYDGLHDEQLRAEVAVVFGNKVNTDGSLSPRLKVRLEQAVFLYQQQRVNAIIVSGGFGKEGFWEAEKMREFLLQAQIPNERIIVDNGGDDTEMTVQNACNIMAQQHWHSVISVSQYFHQTRAKMLFKQHRIDFVSSSSPLFFEWRDLYSLAREFVGFYVDWAKAQINN